MSDIFLCYSRSDKEIAERLEQRLKAEHWSVYRDERTLVGRRWHKEIEKELHTARAVVVLWSGKSRDSDYVLEEADYGKSKEILFPAFIEKVEYPYGFRRIQTADLVGWDGEHSHPGLSRLVESLQAHLQIPEKEPLIFLADAERPPIEEPERAPSLAGQTFRDRLKSGGDGPFMVVIPAGKFLMGSPPDEPERRDNEGPQHEVIISTAFALGAYAVTFEDYDRFCESTLRVPPVDEGWGRDTRPVINVSWEDAQAYCAWLSEQSGQHYHLPSEAQWEYACRAGTSTPFQFGKQVTTEQANFDGNFTYNSSAKGEFREKTLRVGTFPPNAFGLYDMHGNVWEWCQDAWHKNFKNAPSDGSAWESGKGRTRVLRGGSWFDDPRYCRAASRYRCSPDFRANFIGFRVCRVAPIE